MGWRGIALAPPIQTGGQKVWVSLAVVVGVVTAVGFGLRRLLVRAPGIDVGAVSDRWMAENKADKHDRFM